MGLSSQVLWLRHSLVLWGWRTPCFLAVCLRSPCRPPSSPVPMRVSSRAQRKMGSHGWGLMLACCLLLAFTCGPVLGRVSRGPQEQQEGTQEPLLEHAER